MEIQAIIISLILSGFFSGIEIAFVSANKLRIELKKKQGTLSGSILAKFVKKPSEFIGTMLIGNNVVLVIYGIMMAKLLEPALERSLPPAFSAGVYILLLQTIISTAVILIFGEFVPKVLFRINPNAILSAFWFPMIIVYYLLYPVVKLVMIISHFVLNGIFHLNIKESRPVFTKVDLEHFIKQTTTHEQEEMEINTEIFENALYLIKVKVRECMVPRPEIEAVEVNTPISELKQKFIDTGLSRLIIYKEDIDNIIGYVHHFSLLEEPANIQELLMPIPLIPETMTAKDLLNLLIRENRTISWVVDEYGGTAGIVTLEDVLEEIFGDIQDEHDVEELIDKQVADDEFILSGRLEIDYINDKYHLDIPEGEYETLAGYIVDNFGSIPQRNERICLNNFEILILSVSETKIDTVKLKVVEEEGEE